MRDGTKNLKPVQTKEEARERGRRGGIASGKARREKAGLKKLMNIALNMPVKNEKESGKAKNLQKIKALSDVGKSNIDGSTAIIAKIMQGAMKGDPRMIKLALELSGALDPVTEEAEETNDGFLDALNASATEDWENEET